MSRLFNFVLLLSACFLFPNAIMAAVERSEITRVTNVNTWTEYGGGDVVFKTENNMANCSDGYWFTKSNPGFQANLSMVLSAYQAKNPIRVVAYSDSNRRWAGSSGKFCFLYSLELQ